MYIVIMNNDTRQLRSVKLPEDVWEMARTMAEKTHRTRPKYIELAIIEQSKRDNKKNGKN